MEEFVSLSVICLLQHPGPTCACVNELANFHMSAGLTLLGGKSIHEGLHLNVVNLPRYNRV